jgi:hypothetical protein
MTGISTGSAAFTCASAHRPSPFRNGYRFAKWQGKRKFREVMKTPLNKPLLDFTGMRAGKSFTSDSSRCLNCPSNLIGHDHSNKPANGCGV